MRHYRLRLAVVVVLAPFAASAQTPAEPRVLPPGVTEAAPDRGDPTVRLPRPEAKVRVDEKTVAVIRNATGAWQIVAGRTVLHDFGGDMTLADEARRTLRELSATEWVTVGSPRPGVEYGLADGKAAPGTPHPRYSLPINAQTARVEQARGVWVLRDDASILANFGPSRADADQALAAARRYGFNRVGFVGFPAARVTYFYVDPMPGEAASAQTTGLAQAALESTLTRTGVQVPGTETYTGERVVFDPRKVEVRRDKADYVVAHGTDVFARFTGNEWAARDALRAIQDGRFTEFCTVGGATFFLVNGRPPAQVSFGVLTTKFDPKDVKVRPADGGFTLFDPVGRRIATAKTQADADALLKLVQAHGFDTVCQTGQNPRACLRYLARTGR